MKKITFKDLPSTETPINATNLNAMQDNTETEINKIITALTNNKATVTGENITLNDSAEARVEEINIRGNSVQATRNGKNLCNYAISQSGTTRLQSIVFSVLPNTTYTFSTSTSDIQVINYYKDINKDNISNNNWAYVPYTFTTPEDCYYIQQLFKKSDDSDITPEDLLNIQLEEGEVATEYEAYGVMPSPDYPSEINSCGDNVNLLNLGNISGTSNGIEYSVNDKEKIVLNGTCTSDRITINIASFELNGTYTFSIIGHTSSVAIKNSNGNNLFLTSSSITTTIEDTCSQIVIYGLSGTYNNKEIGLKLEKGSKATPYTEYNQGCINETIDNGLETTDSNYKSQTYTIPTQKPFRAIGDYKDTFVKQDGVWYEKHCIGEIIFNGTESWSVARSLTNNLIVQVDVSNLADVQNIDGVVSNYFIGTNGSFIWNADDGEFYIAGNSDNKLRISLNKTDFPATSNFIEWLSANNVLVYYLISTPELIPCTTEQTIKLNEIQALAKTYKNTTHIYSEDEVSPEIEVTYLKDLETMLGGA